MGRFQTVLQLTPGTVVHQEEITEGEHTLSGDRECHGGHPPDSALQHLPRLLQVPDQHPGGRLHVSVLILNLAACPCLLVRITLTI